MRRTPLSLLVIICAFALTTFAQTQSGQRSTPTPMQNLASQNIISGAISIADVPGPFVDSMIPRDNIAGTYILQEVGHLRPVASAGNIIYAVNQEGCTLVAYTTNPFQKVLEVPLGLGANSVYEHPIRPLEIWITDSISNCVSVFDPTTLTLGQTIRTNGAPHGLAFSADGSRAYVTCSSGRTVDVIDTNTFTVVNSIAIPARRPRGIAVVGDNIHVAPLISGNNTTALGASGSGFRFVLDIPAFAGIGAIPLADIDLRTIGISPAGGSFETLNPALEWADLGTSIFNVQNRPGTTELWVCNTDALNAEVIAEPNFVNGKVVRNRVTIVDIAGGPGGSVNHVDLDQVGGVGCSQPRGVAFDSLRGRVYVMCEGSDRVAVLDLNGNWLGSWKLTGQGKIRCLPHGGTVLGENLYVWNKGTNSITKINVVTTPLDSTVNNHKSLGLTPLTDAVRRGRSIVNNADLSAGGSSSCASCHIDGDQDGVVWDLSNVLDPEGTPNNQLSLFIDRKGAMVTQSLNGLPEGAPYHWRGERGDIEAFNGAFEGLLDGSELVTADLADMVSYINELHYPANHVQQDDRVTTPNELEGARIFMQETATANARCVDCHSMPTGSNNETMREGSGWAPSLVVTQLRGIADKVLGQHDLGFANIGGNMIDLGDCTEFGPGLVHDGRIATLFDFSNSFVNIDPTEAMRLEDFMRAFDTGLAPATAIQATMTQANAFTLPEFNLLLSEADQGECDLVATGSVAVGSAQPIRVRAYYNPQTGFFEFDSKAYGLASPSFLQLLANGNYGSWTLRGVPVGMGRRTVDSDMDGIANLDEAAFNTTADNPDADGDGFPDGYEQLWGMDPNVVDTSSPDSQAPGIISAIPLYATTNTVKLDVKTDELCVVTASWIGKRGSEVRVSSKFAPYAKDHQFVINFLPQNVTTLVTLTAVDPNNLSSTMTVGVVADAEIVRDIHIDAMTLSTGLIAVNMTTGMATTNFTAVVDVKDHLGAPAAAGYEATAFVYLESTPGQVNVVQSAIVATTNAAGQVTFSLPLTWPVSGGGVRNVYFGVIDIVPSTGSGLANAYTEANDTLNFMSLTF